MKKVFSLVKNAKKFTQTANELVYATLYPAAAEALLADTPTARQLTHSELVDLACAIDLSRCLNKGQMPVCASRAGHLEARPAGVYRVRSSDAPDARRRWVAR